VTASILSTGTAGAHRAEPAAVTDRPRWARPALAGLLVGTAVLYLWGLGASGYANEFYAAAVQAGTQSWKALLFGALDAGNGITVDKPPAAMWVMGLSGRIFGFSSWSMLVPQALMGVGSVALLYGTVRRVAGYAAGLGAGAILALTPVAVLMFRFNNPDALLVLLLVAAAYCVTRAVERGRLGWLLLAGTAVGFGFLTKMMQAFLVLPAFALVYLVAAPTPLLRRIWHTLAAGAAMVVSAGWYVALVELWPASSRPYIGGSTDNSLWQLAVGYNGLSRIFGGSGNGGGGRNFGGGFGGATGITRLFNSQFGTEISWLLPASLIALAAGLWLTRRAPRTDGTRAAMLLWGGWLLVTGLVFSYMSGIIHEYYTVALAPAIAALVAISVRLLWTQRGRFEARAALAAMVAVTAVWSYVLLDRDAGWQPWLRYSVLIAAAVATVWLLVGGTAVRRATLVLAAVLVFAGFAAPTAYAAVTAATTHNGSTPTSGPASAGTGFGRPGGSGTGTPPGASGSGSSNRYSGGFPGNGTPPGGSGSFPGARTGTPPGGSGSRADGFPGRGTTGTNGTTGKARSGSMPGFGGMGRTGTSNSKLTALLKTTNTRWAAAVIGSQSAASLELSSGTSVLAIGGWSGTDDYPTLAQFKQYVASGEIRYLIAGGQSGGGMMGGGSGPGSQITTWVKAHFTSKTVGGTTVYDLKSPKS
jgi:4-amino-4-deoxy-L-arabinose transferase-like glycosyltransferase